MATYVLSEPVCCLPVKRLLPIIILFFPRLSQRTYQWPIVCLSQTFDLQKPCPHLFPASLQQPWAVPGIHFDGFKKTRLTRSISTDNAEQTKSGGSDWRSAVMGQGEIILTSFYPPPPPSHTHFFSNVVFEPHTHSECLTKR